MSNGVSIPFFTGAMRLLAQTHGKKMGGPQLERMRAALQEAEEAFLELPDVPVKSKRKSKSKTNDA